MNLSANLFRSLSLLPTAIHRTIQTKSIRHLLAFDATADPAEEIRIVGWIKSYRDHNKLKFIHIQDGSDHRNLQLVIDLQSSQHNKGSQLQIGDKDLFKKLNLNTSIEVTGKLVRSLNSRQSVELQVTGLSVIGECDANTYPFKAKAKLKLEAIRGHVHLRAHTDEFANIMRFRSQLTFSLHEFFNAEKFVQIHTPVVTANNCEGGCETFRVEGGQDKNGEFFGSPAYLSASAQLHLETMTTTLAKVYTLSPAFRAEKSQTRHHLAEFYMLEAELIDMNSLDQLLDFTETFVRHVTLGVYSKFDPDFFASFSRQQQATNKKLKKGVNKREDVVYTDLIRACVQRPFIRITYTEAILILNGLLKGSLGKKMSKKSIEFGEDLNKEQEKLLVEHFENVPVFVTNYPSALKPFYMRQSVEKVGFVENFDLLAPFVGEIIGGSLREYRQDVLVEAMVRQKLDVVGYESYLETKKYGGMRMGGFGLGLERFIQFLVNIDNIRDTCAFPRFLHHCKM